MERDAWDPYPEDAYDDDDRPSAAELAEDEAEHKRWMHRYRTDPQFRAQVAEANRRAIEQFPGRRPEGDDDERTPDE